jgi:HlyD family secretion protein
MSRQTIRRLIMAGIGAVIALFLVYSFMPAPVAVDLGQVTRGALTVTIDEEARTRVRDVYVVSAPVSGRLLRITGDPGDPVAANETVLARLLPSDPDFLDVRTQTQARAAVQSAEAALTLAGSEVQRAEADAEYAWSEYQRAQQLVKRQTVSRAVLERAERDWRAAQAALETAKATVRVRQAELDNARARLIDPAESERNGEAAGVLAIRAPVNGRILRVMQQSESVVVAGTPLIEIGDPRGDLEVIAELLSTDAVRVNEGDRVIIDKWGGEDLLTGRVERVEPFGRTKISALGVEEQRVNVIIELDDGPEARGSLGHGFRVEVRIVVWEEDDVLQAPSSALFRHQGEWAVFAVRNGRARLTKVSIGRNNGRQAQVLEGLSEGDRVVLYPPNDVEDGVGVVQR